MPASRNTVDRTMHAPSVSVAANPSVGEGTLSRVSALVAMMRPLHWIKNLLLFVPLLLSPEVSVPASWLKALVGFVAFSLGASSVYVLNDSFDIGTDRQHPEKKRRPCAGGAIPVRWARLTAILLASLGLAISWWLPAHRRWHLRSRRLEGSGLSGGPVERVSLQLAPLAHEQSHGLNTDRRLRVGHDASLRGDFWGLPTSVWVTLVRLAA
ncbi:MAG: hypothetical protein FJW39_29830 [Acidobacteria bacterium]|nr:hypothetical protein [Acidobacteriota bacterium]